MFVPAVLIMLESRDRSDGGTAAAAAAAAGPLNTFCVQQSRVEQCFGRYTAVSLVLHEDFASAESHSISSKCKVACEVLTFLQKVVSWCTSN